MEQFKNQADTDQPLAHEAGVNHTVNAHDSQLKPQNLRTANFLAHEMIAGLYEKVPVDTAISKQGTVELDDDQ